MAWTLVAALLGQAAADPASRALANATAGSIWRVSVLWLRNQLESATQLEDIVVGGHQWCRAHVPDDSWSLSLGPQHLDSKPLAEAARAAFVPRQDGLLVKLSKKTTAMVCVEAARVYHFGQVLTYNLFWRLAVKRTSLRMGVRWNLFGLRGGAFDSRQAS